MNKERIKKRLLQGKPLNDLFFWSKGGNDNAIYKSDHFYKSDDVIYIPDTYINSMDLLFDSILTLKQIDEVIEEMYTGNDFIFECKGNLLLAIDLFHYCDWQYPSVPLMTYYPTLTDYEMIKICGTTYNDLFVTEKRCYVLHNQNYTDGNRYDVFYNEQDAREAMESDVENVIWFLNEDMHKYEKSTHDNVLKIYVPDTDIYYEWEICKSNIV